MAEDRQHHETPRLPFPSMMAPMYREMAEMLGLPASDADAEAFRLSIPRWPAFPDSVAALKRLRKHFYLVAMTNSDNWALSHFAEHAGASLRRPGDGRNGGLEQAGPAGLRLHPRPALEGGLSASTTSSTWRRASTTTSPWRRRLGYHTCWIERRKGKPGAGATPRCRMWRFRIITSRAWRNWLMRWIRGSRKISSYIDFFPST